MPVNLMPVAACLGRRGRWSIRWPAVFLALLILFALSGCAVRAPAAPAPVADLGYSSYSDARSEAFDSVREMRNRLMGGCAGIDPTQLSTNTSYLVGSESDFRRCIRDKVTAAFANSEGVTHCAGKEDVSAYIVCISMGDWLNALLHSAGSPKSLSPAEWLDTPMAITNTADELTALSLTRCATTRSQNTLGDCQLALLVEALSTSSGDLAVCHGEMGLRVQCVAYKSIARYLRDKTMLIW